MAKEEFEELVKDAKWGFLREDQEDADKAGIDADTGLFRTSLYDYLKAIFPDTDDWIHDKKIPDSDRDFRPDYRSESLKLIVEFDGFPHYKQPDTIRKDAEKTKFYQELGYKVVRIPYFIQLTKKAIKTLFDVDMAEEMFIEQIPSLGPAGCSTPAYLCGAGIQRMAEEFVKFPEQYEVNIKYLKSFDDEFLTSANLLESLYNINKQKA